MKKLFFAVAAMAAMLTSCSKDDAFGGLSHGKVTFEVSTPELTTRAYGDGKTATKLYYAVYDVTENGAMVKTNYNDTIEDDVQLSNLKASFAIDLVEGRKYEVAFWAESDNSPYIFDTEKKTVSYKANNLLKANNETYDAFFAYVPEGDVKVGQVVNVTLKRPFAQLNVATNDTQKASDLGVTVAQTGIKVYAYTSFDLKSGDVIGEKKELTFDMENVGDDTATEVVEHTLGTITANNNNYDWLTMNYILVNERENIDITFLFEDNKGKADYTRPYAAVPVQRNYRTNVIGSILTDPTDFNVEIKPGVDGTIEHEIIEVNNASDLAAVFKDLNDDDSTNDPSSIIFTDDINLNDLFAMSSQSSATYSAVTRANADPTITIAAGKKLSIDLNGKKLSATSSQTGKNYDMFDVRGTLTVVNGTMEYKHEGENMGWGSSTNLFNVTGGGVLNLERVTAKNLGGSDMGFVAHLNNWGEVTLNVENSTLESNYVAVRVFNSGNDMNNVTIKNSTLKGVSAAFWVHNYTVEDFGTAAKVEAQKALLNLNIYNQGNTFSPDVNGIRYGFTNSIRTDSYGITKSVSEDGTEVTLGYFFDDNKGLIRRGVAGDEGNTTITKVVVEEGIETLYDRTFRRFYALETVELPNTLTTIGAAGSGVFQSCTNLKSVVIPESVTVLGKGSFQECSSLESINIPAGVTRIEENALRATGLKEVEFHAGVIYFGAQAFRDCKQLTKVVINAPEFTIEANAFGVMSAPYTPMTIEVANAEMKAYVESKLTAHAKTYITVVAPEVVDNTAGLQAALTEGKNVVLASDLTIRADEMLTAPYGNKMALSHNGGVFDGNNKTISATIGGDNYVVMTNGGTIKNLNIDNGFRGIVIMSANQTIKLENVVSSGEGVCYALNTAEGDSTQDLIATNCTFNGWSSWSLLKSATFTNCTFGQGQYYTNVYGRLGKPYVNTLFDGCEFGSKFYIDLSALGADQKVTLKNCTVNGVKLTAANWTSLVAPEDTCGEGQISIELKNGTYMTADNVADYVIFE